MSIKARVADRNRFRGIFTATDEQGEEYNFLDYNIFFATEVKRFV